MFPLASFCGGRLSFINQQALLLTPTILQSYETDLTFHKTKHLLITESYIDVFNFPYLLRCIVFVFIYRRTQSNLSLERVIISQEGFQSAIIKNIVGNKKRPLFLFLKEIRTRNSFFFLLRLTLSTRSLSKASRLLSVELKV